MRLMRTSTISMPNALASSASRCCTPFITSSRSVASSSRAVRLFTSFFSASWTTEVSRFSAVLILTPPELVRMNCLGSAMRHFTSQSITRFFFSAVCSEPVSGLSSVRTLRSRNTTFWNGGGSLNRRPGSVMTSRIWPKE